METTMDLNKLRARGEDGEPHRFDVHALRGMVVDHIIATKRAGEPSISFDSLMPDIFVDRATGEDVDVTVGEALDVIADYFGN
jgi:hypothetical protein